ncbi:hypothetical protein [Nocardia jejuensis]|uniref:hypothetical protein n=1 Tax=Nocardia jejuensis TaxID=328049 RepID=UPI00082A182B|nr:hypothetical protein [Nocardia jejuensis]
MAIRAHDVGPIAAEAAFTSDFAVGTEVPMSEFANKQDVERRIMNDRPGILTKYMPVRYDGATGTVLTGCRYLFDTGENAQRYRRFLAEELEFEPGIKFWSRRSLIDVDRRLWRVAGAHNFTPRSEHAVDRFERFVFPDGDPGAQLEKIWPTVRSAARERGLGAAWLLYQPQERQLAIHTVAHKIDAGDPTTSAEAALHHISSVPSLDVLLPPELYARKVFDRSAMICSIGRRAPAAQPLIR